ncbi:unnamed protein product, partial [Hapterophycus canaliculatus]
MKTSCARRALVLLLLQAHVAAFSGPSPRQRRPRVQASSSPPAGSPTLSSRASYPPSAFRRARPGQAPPILGGRGGGGSCSIRDAASPQLHIPLTVLQGWFDGWGGADSASTPDKGGKNAGGSGSAGAGKSSEGRGSSGGGGAGGDKARRKSPGGIGGRSSGSARRPVAGERGKPSAQGGGSSNIFSGLGRLGNGGKGTSSSSGGGGGGKEAGARQKGKGGRSASLGNSARAKSPGGAMQTLAAVGESFSVGAAAFQDRFSEIGSQNVSFILPAGKVANLTVPWKGVGIYAGGLLSGLALAVGLLTVPYTELGSPGLRKSLTLFENVLVDIDQGYVEEVNPERLLETAVVSMLRTLDPYTEYQNNQAAADLKETVSGRYGGVGLVISGGKQRTEQQPKSEAEPPNQGQKKKQEKGEGKGESGPTKKRLPAGTGARGRGGERAGRDGITVVSAFEGYAFDAGMRAGDRITAINGKPVEGMTVDKV